MRGRALSCFRLVSALFVSSLVVACHARDIDEPGPLLAPLVDPGSAEEAGIVAFVNDASTTRVLLDDTVGLDRRAASGLIAARPFEDIAGVDAVPYVGSVALQRLLDWAERDGWVAMFRADRDGATLALVNAPEATLALLDDDVGLDRRAASNIVSTRAGADGVAGTADDVTFVSIEQLDAVSYVGPSALELLAVYALANGFAPAPGGPALPCAIVSEVLEGPGRNNKAVEVYNCGSEAIVLDQLGICLVSNDHTDCSASRSAGSGTLLPGETWVMCRTRSGPAGDPYPGIVSACQRELGAAMNFNGDDRIVLFHDIDADGARDADEPTLDAFGDPASRPASAPWGELNLRRCDLAPRTSGEFDVDAHFTRHGSTSFSHLGVAPTDTCGAGGVGAPGDTCRAPEGCATDLRCLGIPGDGSGDAGQCVDESPLDGEGDGCDRHAPCNDGLLCAGWTVWGEGTCVPSWMGGRWSDEPALAIPETSGGTSASIVVSGLASVPVDIEVTAHIEHPRHADLRVTLVDPNGDEAVLWDRTAELATWSRSFVLSGISRDDAVNGRWTLRLEDLASGQTGTLERWTLFIVSRWD